LSREAIAALPKVELHVHLDCCLSFDAVARLAPGTTPEAYRDVLERYGIAPGAFLMVGNSLKSDILPVLAIGGQAAHVEYPLCWEHEKVPGSELEGKPFHRLASLADLPALVAAHRTAVSTTD
jgi:FMN phosphatase YigB (HAD superfamily)